MFFIIHFFLELPISFSLISKEKKVNKTKRNTKLKINNEMRELRANVNEVLKTEENSILTV